MLGGPIAASIVGEMAKNGSPGLLNMAGRAIGLGQNEQAALVQGKIPFWVWLVMGVAGGYALCSYMPRIRQAVGSSAGANEDK